MLHGAAHEDFHARRKGRKHAGRTAWRSRTCVPATSRVASRQRTLLPFPKNDVAFESFRSHQAILPTYASHSPQTPCPLRRSVFKMRATFLHVCEINFLRFNRLARCVSCFALRVEAVSSRHGNLALPVLSNCARLSRAPRERPSANAAAAVAPRAVVRSPFLTGDSLHVDDQHRQLAQAVVRRRHTTVSGDC